MISGGPDDQLAQLSDALSAMASVVMGDETLDAVLQLVVSLADSTIIGLMGSSVSILRTQTFETMGASSELVRQLDALQYQTEAGPCVEAIRTGSRQRVDIDGAERRWAVFGAQARRAGIGAVLSQPLGGQDRTIGALNLYAADDSVFDGSGGATAELFARHASAVVANAAAFAASETINRNLMQALESRQLIGQAIGILMVEQRCDGEEAFDILRRASQRSHRKLREVAAQTVRAHEPPRSERG